MWMGMAWPPSTHKAPIKHLEAAWACSTTMWNRSKKAGMKSTSRGLSELHLKAAWSMIINLKAGLWETNIKRVCNEGQVAGGLNSQHH
eukprot:1138709-Pelagomonas_calceolata.AAC.8